MVISTVLVAIMVALVVLTSAVGRAKGAISPDSHNRAIERELSTTVDTLSDLHAHDELLRLKRETLEATGVSSQRMADFLRDIEKRIERADAPNSASRVGRDTSGDSAWN